MSTSQRPVALVTGASSGIGAVFARRLAARGFNLVLVARREDRLQALAAELSSASGAHSELIVADLAAEPGLVAVETVLQSDDRIELLVNNAGMSRIGAFAETPLAGALDQITLNLVAPTRLLHAVLPGMIARHKGTVINMSSALALHGLPGAAVYGGTKAYLLNLSRSLQEELTGSGVRIEVALPAGVATEIYDKSGLPLSALPPELIMTADDMVDAVMAGHDRGEFFVLPSVEDDSLWPAYDAARGALFAATQTGTPATRYRA